MSYKQIAELYKSGISHEHIAILTASQLEDVKLTCANVDVEARMSGLGAQRFNDRQDALEARGKHSDTAAMLDFVFQTLKPVTAAISVYMVENPNSLETRFMQQHDLHSLALSGIRVAVGLTQKEGEVLRFTTACILTMEKVTLDLEPTLAAKCGRVILEALINNTNGMFAKTSKRDDKPPHHNIFIIETTDLFFEWEKEHKLELAELAVMFRPMVVPPRSWDGLQSGGYYADTLKRPFIRNRKKLPLNQYGTKAIPRVYEAVNKIQATPYAINKVVLHTALALRGLLESAAGDDKKLYAHRKFLELEPEAPHTRYARDIREAITKDQEYLGLDKVNFEAALQEDLIDEVTGKKKPKTQLITFGKWVRGCLSKIVGGEEQKAKLRLEANRYDLIQLLKYKASLTSITSKNRVINTALETACEYCDYDAIYFPHNLDWRGRVYPMTAGLTTQGVGLQKALLKFDKGYPIGTKEALEYLEAHVAGSWGLDKTPWLERLAWTRDNREFIQKVADNPVETYDLWKDADSPWLFIAACEAMSTYYRDGLDAIVDIPIPVDATCSGAQHYAALTRDERGAAQVNVTPNGTHGLQDRLTELRKTL